MFKGVLLSPDQITSTPSIQPENAKRVTGRCVFAQHDEM